MAKTATAEEHHILDLLAASEDGCTDHGCRAAPVASICETI
jgi:hypothetical protein